MRNSVILTIAFATSTACATTNSSLMSAMKRYGFDRCRSGPWSGMSYQGYTIDNHVTDECELIVFVKGPDGFVLIAFPDGFTWVPMSKYRSDFFWDFSGRRLFTTNYIHGGRYVGENAYSIDAHEWLPHEWTYEGNTPSGHERVADLVASRFYRINSGTEPAGKKE